MENKSAGVKGKIEQFIEESKNSIAYLHPGKGLNAKDWNAIYDNAIFLFNQWLDESVTPQQITDEDIKEMAEQEIPNHPYPEMNYPADAVTEISRKSFVSGAKAIRDLINK